jgi:hypothetical protein
VCRIGGLACLWAWCVGLAGWGRGQSIDVKTLVEREQKQSGGRLCSCCFRYVPQQDDDVCVCLSPLGAAPARRD